METSVLVNTLVQIIADQTFLPWLLDFCVKSSVIILFTWSVAAMSGTRFASSGRHLLWLNAMGCVALLPVIGALLLGFSNSGWIGEISASLVVLPQISTPLSLTSTYMLDSLLLVYAVVSLLLLSRLGYAAWQLRAIDRAATCVENVQLLNIVDELLSLLEIRRPVVLKTSADIASPISFGLLRPTVILPVTAHLWDKSTVEDVLIHELSHIKRLDWVTMLFCQVLACICWINPLVWMARTQVNVAAEESCDMAVRRLGKDNVRYAQELLRLATADAGKQQANPLVQAMCGQSALAGRIRSILDETAAIRGSKMLNTAGAAAMLLLLGACSNFSLFGTPEQDQEYLPLHTIVPQYPTRAAEEGIEGWVLTRFTVTEQGTVDADSMQVVDAEPADLFNRSSQRALAEFTFKPRIRNGSAVAVPGVQYLFLYSLEDDNVLENVRRPPPAARRAR